jgi:hypothetical protein
MNLRPLALFGIGNQGRSPNVTAQDRINLFIEINQDGEKHVLTMYPTPGLSSFVDFGSTPIRGLYERNNLLYVVHRNKFYQIDNSGAVIERGTLLTGKGRVSISDNGNQIIIVDGVDGYIYNITTLTFVRITAPGWPGADTVDFLSGRFIVNKPNTGLFYVSGLYDGLQWDALDFASAESNPDNLVRVSVDSGQLILFGDKTTEFFGDSGALDFAFARIGSSAIEWGLAARWSVAKFDGGLMFLRKNRLGQVQVALQRGLNAEPVSTPAIDYIFSQYNTTADATGFSYMLSGHAFYQINFPQANASWLFDGQSQSWTRLKSETGRHRAEIQQQLLSKNIVSDYASGRLYTLLDGVYTDNGAPIVREFTSRHLAGGDFSHISQLWLELEGGLGLQMGQGKTPQIMMQVSRDGGHEWGAEIWREFGAVGNYKTRAVWNRIGRARDFLFKFRVTDPVKTVFVAAWGKRSDG